MYTTHQSLLNDNYNETLIICATFSMYDFVCLFFGDDCTIEIYKVKVKKVFEYKTKIQV